MGSKSYRTNTRRRGGNLRLADDGIGWDNGNSLWEDCPLGPAIWDPTILTTYFNDFDSYVTTMDGLTAVATNSGTVTSDAATAGHHGVVSLTPSDGTVVDNDETYLGSTATQFILSAGKDLWFEAMVYFAEAATDDVNVIVGLSSIYAANTLLDNGGGPAADYDGIVFFKVDGGTVWQTETSVATSQTTHTGVQTRASGAWTRLGFKVTGNEQVDFYINGVEKISTTAYLPTAAMGLLFGVKNGADTNVEVLKCDWVRVAQLR